MDEGFIPPGTAAGFVRGIETTFNYTDDDVIASDVEVSRSTSGW